MSAGAHLLVTDEVLMQRCLDLAANGLGRVSPNPMVGAVLVHKGRIIGEGWHQHYGAAHAEVNCIQSVSAEDLPLLPQSTLYVSLEPCAHFGKTPPCADLIVRARIPRVVIGCVDTFSQVAGKGIARLTAANIDVRTGVLERECRLLNRRFFTAQEKQRPYVILKWAQSAEGFFAPADRSRYQLSNETTRRWVHKMRAEEDAILVGFQTAANDNPRLNNRYWPPLEKQPTRIVVDPELQLPQELHLWDDSQETIVFSYHEEREQNRTQWKKMERGKPIFPQIFRSIRPRQSVLVEGGARTLEQLIENGHWDEAFVVQTQTTIGRGIAAPHLEDARLARSFKLGSDLVNLFVHERNAFYL